MRILKYEIKFAASYSFQIPSIRDVLRVDVYDHNDGDRKIYMWAMVDTESPLEEITVEFHMTENKELTSHYDGTEIDASQHLGTIFYHGVYHLFEVER